MNPSSAQLPSAPLAHQQQQDAPSMLDPPFPQHSHTYPLPSLHHPTPIRGYSSPAPQLHAPPPSRPTPQVYAALYDHLVAQWVVKGQEVAAGGDEREVKRARTLREGSEVELEEGEEADGKGGVTPDGDAQAKDEQDREDEPTSRDQRQTSLPPPPTLTRPESNLRGCPSFSPHPLRRKRCTSSPPLPTSHESTTLQRTTSPPPYSAADHRSPPSSPPPRPIAPLPSHRRRSSSDALVNVIKSFEVVLQYRAQGWRILDQTMAMERRRSAGMEGERR